MKTENIKVRIEKSIREKLEQKAVKLGMSISEYIRFLVANDIKT
jgi:antitoxin component of RelBE/YafQ-DinJ toxin-antitoxin module